jgi:acetyltransferase-like isoleucine patch superfamily enzyme
LQTLLCYIAANAAPLTALTADLSIVVSKGVMKFDDGCIVGASIIINAVLTVGGSVAMAAGLTVDTTTVH